MEDLDLFGLVWKFEFLPQPISSGRYRVTVVLAGPNLENEDVRRPVVRTGVFQFPTERGWEPRTYGASETLGLLGGVENSVQRLRSEALERNVSDLATLALMELLRRTGGSSVSGLWQARLRRYLSKAHCFQKWWADLPPCVILLASR